MELIYWAIILLSFAVAMIGLLFPIIPSVLFLLVGFLVYHFGISSEELTSSFWLVMAILTFTLFIADYVSNLYFIKKYGGSKAASWAGTLGLVVGAFIVPPLGLIIAPFLLVLLVEVIQRKDLNTASKVAFGTVIAFLGSTFAKFTIQLLMIVWFFIA